MFYRSIALCFLYCITKTVQMTKGHKNLLQGPNVGQLWVKCQRGWLPYMTDVASQHFKNTQLKTYSLGYIAGINVMTVLSVTF